MAKGKNQKLKILYLLKILMENTDEEHPLTVNQIIELLKGYDIDCERKTVYSDLELLTVFGVDIVCVKSKSTGYYIASRNFELAELKLLVDSVQSSKFLTHKKSNALIKKIETLCSRYEANQLQRQVFVANRIKTMNESVYYTIDKIHNAIHNNVQIRFKYFQYNVKKERVFKKDGNFYVVSPFAMLWDNENYYLVAFDAESGIIKHYRVDKIMHVDILKQPREGLALFEKIDLAAYSNKIFSMFSGEEQCVKLRCENSLISVVIDRFGKDITVIPDGENHFTFHADVMISPQFFAWIFSLENKAEILSPPCVIDDFKTHLRQVSQLYHP